MRNNSVMSLRQQASDANDHGASAAASATFRHSTISMLADVHPGALSDCDSMPAHQPVDVWAWQTQLIGGCHPFRAALADDLGDLDLLALASFSAMRALTIFFTSDSGRGLSAGKRMVPVEVS
jgi:hypothetical protein